MDLKDLIASVLSDSNEALLAFNAGHHEKAEEYLASIEGDIMVYINEHPQPAGDVTESATKEKSAEEQQEKPAEAPRAPAQPAAVDPAAAAQQIGTGSAEPKPPQ